jgi:hypothetical protein
MSATNFSTLYAEWVGRSWYRTIAPRSMHNLFHVPEGSNRADEANAYSRAVTIGSVWFCLIVALALVTLIIMLWFMLSGLYKCTTGKMNDVCCGGAGNVPFEQNGTRTRIRAIAAFLAFLLILVSGIALMVSHSMVHDALLHGITRPARAIAASMDDLAVDAARAVAAVADSIDTSRGSAHVAATAVRAHNTNITTITNGISLACSTLLASINYTTTSGGGRVVVCDGCAAAALACSDFVSATETNLGRTRMVATATVTLFFVGVTGNAAAEAADVNRTISDARVEVADIQADTDYYATKIEKYESYHFTWGMVFLSLVLVLGLMSAFASINVRKCAMRTISFICFVLAILLFVVSLLYLVAAVAGADGCVELGKQEREYVGYHASDGTFVQADSTAARIYRACLSPTTSIMDQFDVSEWVELILDLEITPLVPFGVSHAFDDTCAALAQSSVTSVGNTNGLPPDAVSEVTEWFNDVKQVADAAARGMASVRVEYERQYSNAEVVNSILSQEYVDALDLHELSCFSVRETAVVAVDDMCNMGVRSILLVGAWSVIAAFALVVMAVALQSPAPLRISDAAFWRLQEDTPAQPPAQARPTDTPPQAPAGRGARRAGAPPRIELPMLSDASSGVAGREDAAGLPTSFRVDEADEEPDSG